MTTPPPPPGWEGILDTGEEILWQGRPDGRVAFAARHLLTSAFGLFFAGFALFWMVMASRAGGGFWMFGLLHFAVGLGILAGPVVWPAWVRRHTWYTLTNRRAFIATDMPLMGRRLKSYPITPETALHYDHGDPGSIHFAAEYRQAKSGTRSTPVRFDRIPDGDTVYRLFRDIQRGRA
ncbi:hypothetical protein [Pseudaestuariivita atlantica]|uniref:Aspartate carbamoyltransferase catalytic subunit n=1 Tax=Pseudaestuariivita atlantica TaxID=1317121 RepID=A0A0L1JLJ8_9RHOB|nr:hypothetical protein [Pseudaestuariivita atlantica]KNG92592.1 aspartate carbamoyltransferase catalytic subunit [Pseudaestuariivita atlantica]